MALQIVTDPIGDPRWSDLVHRHPDASVFHSPGWLEALRRTYGFAPIVLTRSGGPRLEDGVVCCPVRRWGARRLVSLPFSDHCEPLVSARAELPALVAEVVAEARGRKWGAVELRPRSAGADVEAAAGRAGLSPGRSYCLHRLDLTARPEELFSRMHPSHTQRAIRRAEREGLTYDAGRSAEHLASFYRLFRLARRRHGLPPQPMAWFRNVLDAIGGRAMVHVARLRGEPAAAMLTLSFRQRLVYKYGGSDARHHHLGAVPFLFWQVIQAGKAGGAAELDLGRSDLDQPGLLAFKDHLGGVRSTLSYYGQGAGRGTGRAWMQRIAEAAVAALPDATLDLAGRVIYRHLY